MVALQESPLKDSGANAAAAPVDFVVIIALQEERDAMLSEMPSLSKSLAVFRSTIPDRVPLSTEL